MENLKEEELLYKREIGGLEKGYAHLVLLIECFLLTHSLFHPLSFLHSSSISEILIV